MIEEKEEMHLYEVDREKQYACDILHSACISIPRECQDCEISKFYNSWKRKELEGLMEEI